MTGGAHLHETGDVPEPSQGAVRTQHVRSDDNTTGELHPEHRCPGDHGVTEEEEEEVKHVNMNEPKHADGLNAKEMQTCFNLVYEQS